MHFLCKLLIGSLFTAAFASAYGDASSRPATPGTTEFTTRVISQASSCPDQGGVLDSVSVPKDMPLELVVLTSQPAPEGGARFQLSADDPSIAAVGDPRQAFATFVVVPEGEFVSNPFTVFGRRVGDTILRATSLTPGFLGFTVPLGSWDVGEDRSARLLDPNAEEKSCRAAPDSAEFATAETDLADCGVRADGAVTDGVSRLLARTRSGLEGTACFELVTPDSRNGEFETAEVRGTEGVSVPELGSIQQASAFYVTPDSFEDSAASREVQMRFSFTPAFGNGNTTTIDTSIMLVRPPVVLIHGLWADPGSWDSDWIRNDQFHTTTTADYEASHDSSFSNNVPRVREFISDAVRESREKRYATTQADVIGHSMGGILARLFIQSDDYARPDNLDEGDIRRLVSVGTPHLGSSFANLIVALHNRDADETLDAIQALIPADGASPRRGAICDLAENSQAIVQLAQGTEIPAHVITGSDGPAGTPEEPADYWGGVFGINSFEGRLTMEPCIRRNFLGICQERGDPVFDQDIVDGHRFRQANDVIVGASSGRAGLAAGSPALRDFPDLIHFGAPFVAGLTNRGVVPVHALPLLDLALDEPVWVASLPPFVTGPPPDGMGQPWTVPGIPGGREPNVEAFLAECTPGGPMKPGGGGAGPRAVSAQAVDAIRILEPVEDQQFAPGGMVAVDLAIDPDLVASDADVAVLGLGNLEVEFSDAQTVHAEFLIPLEFAGPLRLRPRVRLESGEWIRGPVRRVLVVPEDTPEEIFIAQQRFNLDLEAGQSAQLSIGGIYANGVRRDLTDASTGTTYISDDPMVVEVGANGAIIPVNDGTAAITIEHRGLIDFATVIVRRGQAFLDPDDVTDRLTLSRSGFRLNRNSGFFVQQLSIENAGSTPVIGPLYALVRDLTDGVDVVNNDSLTTSLEPPGTPYFRLPLVTDGLNLFPGENVRFTFDFLNQDRLGVDYQADVLRTARDP